MDLLTFLLVGGTIAIAANSPYFAMQILRRIKLRKRYPTRKFSSAFSLLKRRGDILVEERNHQIYISLTERGKMKMGRFQINELKIKKPKKWDKKWRIIIFDIANLKKVHREALRGKLKQLGFYPLQKSVWLHPFNCKDEIGILKDFFGLGEKEIRLILADSIGGDDNFKKIFGLK